METLIILIFLLGYIAIALEHPFKIDKAASALVTGVLCWAVFVLGAKEVPMHLDHEYGAFLKEAGHLSENYLAYFFEHRLLHHLSEIASILFFLLGAMTIVELVDAHEGFSLITDRIRTTNPVKLLWIVCILTFFFSAALDNLTTTIVMISLMRKLVKNTGQRWFFVGMVVVAANAGGAWSPIGDVTTTMLWIKGQLPDVPNMVVSLIIPSLVCMIVPLVVASLRLKGKVERPMRSEGLEHYVNPVSPGEQKLIFVLGISGLLFVPVFKTVTHLPPFMGMMLSLGVLWIVTELIHQSKNREEKSALSVISVLRKVDTPSVLFFLGILLAVSALQEVGHLRVVAGYLDREIGNLHVINMAIGLLSSVVDNVPLVAGAQGMYEIAQSGPFAAGGSFWLFLAYCAGTGGSALIIGSAAGVAAMGLERIDFIWYVKRISLLAILGYFAGAAVYVLMF